MKRLWLLLVLTACGGPVGNHAVPEPAKPVELSRYLGKWYEFARYENSFEKGCEGVTAEYSPLPENRIRVLNTCYKGGPEGKEDSADGKAKIVPESGNAKLKVSFFGPFYGDYWVLDHAGDYSWSIVGEPSGRYVWILTREAKPAEGEALVQRAKGLGYNTGMLHFTRH